MTVITRMIKFLRVGVGISNTDVEYADSTSNKTAPTSGWQTNAPAWQNGHYIWTRTRIYYTDGNEKITDPVCLPSGKGIAKIEEWYYQSSSATTLTGGSWVKDKAPTWRDGWYVWTKSIIIYTDGSTTSTDPVCSTGGKGSKGDKGVGVKGFNTYYGLSRDKSSPPTAYDYNTLSETIIKTNSDMYVWSADKVLYTDGTGGDFINAYCIGKCSDLTSVKEQYGTSTSAGTKPSSWEYTYPSNPANGTYVWSRDEIVWAGDNSTTHSDAQLIGYIAVNGEAGAGMVVAYQQALSKPTNKPLVTSYETYKNKDTNNLQNNWFKSAPSAQRVLVSGGSVPNVSYNENWSIGEWVATSDNGHTWYKSPEVNHGALSQMRINFTTTVDEQYVTFYLKTYSEENYDFLLISEIDSEHISVSDYTERASGNGVEVQARLKCDKAGTHFVCVAYAKDSDGVANGDYGLVRMATNENYVYASTLLYRCDGDVKDGVISWGSIYQAQGDKGDDGVGSVVAYQCDSVLPTRKPSATSYDFYKHNDDLGNKWKKSAPPVIEGLYSGGSISGTVQYNQNLNGDAWTSGVSDGNHTWYQSPASMTNQDKKNGFCSMQVRFTTTVDDQYVTFYLKAYSEEGYDWILLSKLDSSTVSITNYYSHVSGNGKTVQIQMKCGKAGSHFVTVAYSKDGSGDKNGDYVLFRMATSENYVLTKPLLYRCDGDVKDGVISWGSIYQAQGDKGDKGDKGDRGDQGEKGKYMRGPQDWDSLPDGTTFYPLENNEVAFFDTVEYKGKYYECCKKHTKNSAVTPLADYESNGGSGNWKVSVQFSMVAAKVLWSLIGQIDFFGSQRISVRSSTTSQRVEIENGLIKIFGTVNNIQPNIQFGTDETGASVLSYYDNDGNFLYNLGPSGLDASGMTSAKIESVRVAKVSDVTCETPFSTSKKYGDTSYEVCCNYSVQENLFGTSALVENSGEAQVGYKPVKDRMVTIQTLYRYTAARINNTYAADSARGLTAELAGKANGKFFTSSTKLGENGQLVNLASGEYIKEDESVMMSLRYAFSTASLPKYRIRIYKYTLGTSVARFIYSLIESKGGNQTIIN